MFSKDECICIMEHLNNGESSDVKESVKKKIRKYLDVSSFVNWVFDWKELNGKILNVQVGVDTVQDGIETLVVTGYDSDKDKYYVLHEERNIKL